MPFFIGLAAHFYNHGRNGVRNESVFEGVQVGQQSKFPCRIPEETKDVFGLRKRLLDVRLEHHDKSRYNDQICANYLFQHSLGNVNYRRSSAPSAMFI